jgi:O-antigen/teichoic acid export membrane protein
MNLPILFYMLWNMDMLATLLGEGYAQLAIFFYILSIGYLSDLFTGITGSILRATEHESYEIYNELVRFISGALILIIWHYSDYVVAYAISGATLFYNISKYIQVYRLFRFKPIRMEHIKSMILHLAAFSLFLYGISGLGKYFSLGFGLAGLLLYYGLVYTYFKNRLHITEVYQ